MQQNTTVFTTHMQVPMRQAYPQTSTGIDGADGVQQAKDHR